MNDGNKWESYYRDLFDENRINSYDLDKLCSHLNNHKKSYSNTNLNHKITGKEIKKSIKKLKAKKAAGFDRISNEMLKCSFPYLEKVFVKLFNLIFEARTIPPTWCQGLISPRPICVTSCFCKLFCLLLNERHSLFLTENKIISPSQIGFQNKSRTADHIFCLKSLVNKFVHNTERGKIYACFVDFKKAYDTVWQEGLFTKLKKAYLPNSSALMSVVVS